LCPLARHEAAAGGSAGAHPARRDSPAPAFARTADAPPTTPRRPGGRRRAPPSGLQPGGRGARLPLHREGPGVAATRGPGGTGGTPTVPAGAGGRTVTWSVCCTETPSASVAPTVMVAVPYFPGVKVRVSAATERSVPTSPEFVLPRIDSCSPSPCWRPL